MCALATRPRSTFFSPANHQLIAFLESSLQTLPFARWPWLSMGARTRDFDHTIVLSQAACATDPLSVRCFSSTHENTTRVQHPLPYAAIYFEAILMLRGRSDYIKIVFLCPALDTGIPIILFSCAQRWTQENNIIVAARCSRRERTTARVY
eukprot:SAG31_NODE_2254_length_6073_cov_3.048711_5_plen_151_part_00